jgi:serine/threonine protein kinase
MVLDYANQGNLKDYIANKEKFDSLKWENKIQMALDITRGLRHLHSKNIIHRDLVKFILNILFVRLFLSLNYGLVISIIIL